MDKKSLWHTLDEKPKFPKNLDEPVCSILVLYDNGNMFLYRYVMDGRPIEIGVPHFNSIEDAIWCYCNDLIPENYDTNKKQSI